MSAGLLKPSVADEDATHTKLRLRQQQQACYYNRGARDLDPLEKERGKFLKKLWCCVGGKYNKII